MSGTITLPETIATPIAGPNVVTANALAASIPLQPTVVAPIEPETAAAPTAPEAVVVANKGVEERTLDKVEGDFKVVGEAFKRLEQDFKTFNKAHDKANAAEANVAQAKSHVQCGDCTTLVKVTDAVQNAKAAEPQFNPAI